MWIVGFPNNKSPIYNLITKLKKALTTEHISTFFAESLI